MAHALAQDLDYILDEAAGIWDQLRGQNLFMTGGTGFVGTWLVESFAWANEKLDLRAKATLLSRNPEAFAGKAPYAVHSSSIAFVRGSAASFEFPEGQFRFVIHAATDQVSEPSPEEPGGTFDRDLPGTRRVLEFARKRGIERLLFTSSGAVYGKQPPDLTHVPEDYVGAPSTVDPGSAYGQAKRASEFLCAMYGRQFGFHPVIARLFAFAGPHLPLDLNFAIGNFVGDVLRGGPVRIGGDGTPRRSYLYAADLVVWLWTMLVRGEGCRPYNVGSAEDVSIAQLAQEVVKSTVPGIPVEVAKQPVPGSPPARYVPSVERAWKELGLKPKISLSEAIRRMYAWNLLTR